jgi:hypothetical protein
MHHTFDPGTWVEAAEMRFQCGSVADQIGFGDQQPVCQRHLFHRLILTIELMNCVDRIDCRHDGIEPQEMRDQWIVQQELHDRGRICQTRGLDENTAKRRNLATIASHQQCAQRLLEVAADCAANTTAREYSHLAIDALDEEMIKTDFAVFVDDDGAVLHVVVAQQAIEQRGLAAAEKAGDQRYRQPFG